MVKITTDVSKSDTAATVKSRITSIIQYFLGSSALTGVTTWGQVRALLNSIGFSSHQILDEEVSDSVLNKLNHLNDLDNAPFKLDFMNEGLDSRIDFTRASGGGRFNKQGVYEWVGVNVPRFDYDPVTLEPRGLLIEGSRTNLLLQSNNCANAVWIKSASIALAGYIVTASNAAHAIYQTLTVTQGTIYTFSFYAQRGTMTDAKYSVFDLTNSLNIVAPTSYYSSISDARMTRVTVTFTAPAGCTTVRVFPLRDSGVTGTITIGSDLLGSQLEAGAFPTSYIPTTIAAATRAAERVQISAANTAAWLNKPEGTFGIDFTGFGVGATCGVLFVQKTTSAPRYQMTYSPNGAVGGAIVNDADVVTLGGLTFGAPVAHGSEVRAVLAYKVLDVAGTRNGAVPATGAPASVPLTIDTILIGEANNERLFGHVRRLRYWPKRLPNSFLQAVTQ